MSEPLLGTSTITTALTGVSLYGFISKNGYDVIFGALAGAIFYTASAAELSKFRRLAYFIVSYIAGVVCSGLVGAKLKELTGYSDKPLDALGAVLVSALAINILKSLNNEFLSIIKWLRGTDRHSRK